MNTTADSKEIPRSKNRVLRHFSQALTAIEAQTWDAWNPKWLGISPASGPRIHNFFRQQATDWMAWIDSQGEEDNFDMIEFMAFAPGLLAPPDDAQKAVLKLVPAIPQDQSVYVWLLNQLEGVAEARDIYRSLAGAMWEAHFFYLSLLELHQVEHGPTGRARENSIDSEDANSEGNAASSGHGAASTIESGLPSSSPTVSVPNSVA